MEIKFVNDENKEFNRKEPLGIFYSWVKFMENDIIFICIYIPRQKMSVSQ